MIKNVVKGKIPRIIKLATTAAATAVKNKIVNVSDLVKKVHHDPKRSKMENKCIDNSDYDKLTSNTLDAKIKKS